MNIQPISDDDVIVWPDGTWCTRAALPDMGWLSDDYAVHPVGSPEWLNYMETQE